MSTSLDIPVFDIPLIHDENPPSETQPYSEILLKGPHTLNFSLSGNTEYIKIIYNLDYTEQCGTISQPASGQKIIEATRQVNTPLLIDPSATSLTADFYPDKYQYKKTYFPGLTTIDKDFNTVTHQLSVTIAQPSYNNFVNEVNLLDVRTFTNIEDTRGKAILLMEDVNNQWTIPVTLFGEGEFGSVIQLGDTVFGNIRFDVCLSKAPYSNIKPDGTESITAFPRDTIFLGYIRG